MKGQARLYFDSLPQAARRRYRRLGTRFTPSARNPLESNERVGGEGGGEEEENKECQMRVAYIYIYIYYMHIGTTIAVYVVSTPARRPACHLPRTPQNKHHARTRRIVIIYRILYASR